MDMIEKVAAVFRRANESGAQFRYEDVARKAVEAMRETPECITKINGSANWPMMIDAILKTSPTSPSPEPHK